MWGPIERRSTCQLQYGATEKNVLRLEVQVGDVPFMEELQGACCRQVGNGDRGQHSHTGAFLRITSQQAGAASPPGLHLHSWWTLTYLLQKATSYPLWEQTAAADEAGQVSSRAPLQDQVDVLRVPLQSRGGKASVLSGTPPASHIRSPWGVLS